MFVSQRLQPRPCVPTFSLAHICESCMVCHPLIHTQLGCRVWVPPSHPHTAGMSLLHMDEMKFIMYIRCAPAVHSYALLTGYTVIHHFAWKLWLLNCKFEQKRLNIQMFNSVVHFETFKFLFRFFYGFKFYHSASLASHVRSADLQNRGWFVQLLLKIISGKQCQSYFLLSNCWRREQPMFFLWNWLYGLWLHNRS